MNKADLVDALEVRLGGKKAASDALEAIFDVIIREVARGGKVGITGFGTFERVDRAPRTGRNPHTGEAVPIAATSRPRFRPGSYFTSVVADPSLLPATRLAGARVGTAGADGTAEPAAVDARSERQVDAHVETRAEGGNGTPASIRRTTPPEDQDPVVEETLPQRSRPRTSGTPASVRADRSERKDEPRREPALGGRLMLGGEEITRSMIKAKKAQLARAKDDELADRPKGKKSKKGKKKKGRKTGDGPSD